MKQKMRFNEAELSLLKSLFADDEGMLLAVRKVFFERDLSDVDAKFLKHLQKDKVKTLIRKVFIPELDLDAPVGQMVDLMLTINVSQMTPEEADRQIKARLIVIDLLNAHLDELEGKAPSLSFKHLVEMSDDITQNFINLTARNSYVAHVEAMLQQIMLLAGRKDETPEQTQERLQKDSSK